MSIQDKLQAGTATNNEILDRVGAVVTSELGVYKVRIHVDGRYVMNHHFDHTNLQDAVDLFKACFPGWEWGRMLGTGDIIINETGNQFSPNYYGNSDNPATALLIAMFDAMGVK